MMIAAAITAVASTGHAQTSSPSPASQRSDPVLTFSTSLASDFNTLDLVPEPNCQACVVGALVSAKVDQFKTVSAAVDGVGFFGGIYHPAKDVHIAFGGYVQSNGTNQFAEGNTRDKTTDVITPGGYLQTDFPIYGATQSLKFRSGEAFASAGDSRDATTVLEWQPLLPFETGQFNLGKRVHVEELKWVEVFWAPEAMIQYDHFVGGMKTYAIFSRHDDALRIGPQVSATFYCNPGLCTDDTSVAARLGLTITGHVADDVLGKKAYGLVQAALNYQLNSNFGVAASYGYGNSDVTGNAQSQIKIGLTIKLKPPR